jgi:hypothetical protein
MSLTAGITLSSQATGYQTKGCREPWHGDQSDQPKHCLKGERSWNNTLHITLAPCMWLLTADRNDPGNVIAIRSSAQTAVLATGVHCPRTL